MKNVLFAVFLMLTANVFAQSKKMEQVAAATQALRVAMISPSQVALDAVLGDSLSYGHSGGKIETKADLVANLLNGNSDFVTIDISNQHIQLYKNSAIVRHHLVAQTNDKGKPATVKLDILLVWQHERSGWKLVARQAVKSN